MGRVTVEATIESLADLHVADRGFLPPAEVRRVSIVTLVDTGASMLSLPKRYIDALGLKKAYTKPSRSARGAGTVDVYQAVRLTVQGRNCNVDVVELPDEVPALLGQIPLEAMDWVVDPVAQRLIGNPDHGGEWMIEMY